MTSPAVINSEAIAFTEKKVDMALDDIIKMSKTKTTKSKRQMVPNKSHKLFGGNGTQKSLKVRKYMESRSSLRQGVLAQRRSNFQGGRFPVATEAAKNAVVAPMRIRGFNRNRTANWNRPRTSAAMNRQGNGPAKGFAIKPRIQQLQQHRQQQQSHQQIMPKTLDSLFASMKEQRMQTFGHQSNAQNQRTVQPRQQWGRGQRSHY
ncbi:hypothetical protein V2J09_004952 [Rumex salicifolius]